MKSPTNKRSILGLILVLIGAIFLIDNLGFDIPFPGLVFAWPIVFIIIGLINVFTGNFRIAFLFFALGVFFYFQSYDIIDVSTYWPVFLIVVGLAFLLRDRKRRPDRKETDRDHFDEISIFGGNEKKFISDHLKGGKVTTIFGGSEIDLRGSKAENGAVIEVFTMFGGCELLIPPDWKLNVDAIAIFGGFGDARTDIDPNPSTTVKIKGFTMFGGGEIKN